MSSEAAQRLFGTDGIRAVAGRFPLDEQTIEIIGRSLAARLASQIGHAPSIIIGRDTRESGAMIETALARGAAAQGARVESAGVITTPGVAYIARTTPFDAGIVISASHNPYRDNGIKVFSPSGRKLDDETERSIEADIFKARQSGSEPAPAIPPLEASSGYRAKYIDFLVDEVGAGLNLRHLRIAVDCANGAASTVAPEVFTRLGARVTLLSASPDGRNINEGCGSLHTGTLQQTVTEQGLDLGIAFDGDADRALFVDSTGLLADGDHVLLILGEHMKSHGELAGNLVVSTVMSNIGLELALRDRGIELVRAQVGDRYVLEQLLARGARLGGEQSGHIILPAISLAGDGLITAIEMLRALDEKKATLAELAGSLAKFPQVLVNVRVSSKPQLESIPEVKAAMVALEEEMNGRGRLLVRYSGTENLARVMIEGEHQETIDRQAHSLAEVIREAIG